MKLRASPVDVERSKPRDNTQGNGIFLERVYKRLLNRDCYDIFNEEAEIMFCVRVILLWHTSKQGILSITHGRKSSKETDTIHLLMRSPCRSWVFFSVVHECRVFIWTLSNSALRGNVFSINHENNI